MKLDEEAKECLLEEIYKKNKQYGSKVKRAMDEISYKELKDPCCIAWYSLRVKQCRKDRKLTQEEVAQYFGVTDGMVSHDEKKAREYIVENLVGEKDEKYYETLSNIDRIYLAANALLYDVSPLYLIGKVNNPGSYTLKERRTIPLETNTIAEEKSKDEEQKNQDLGSNIVSSKAMDQRSKGNENVLFEPLIDLDANVVKKIRTIFANLFNTQENKRLLIQLYTLTKARQSWREKICNEIKNNVFVKDILNQSYKTCIIRIEPKDMMEWNLDRIENDLIDFAKIEPEIFDIVFKLSFHHEIARELCDKFEEAGYLNAPWRIKK